MGYRCRTCEACHDERPTCFRAAFPAAVAELSELELQTRVERGSDQCILAGTHFFILGNLDSINIKAMVHTESVGIRPKIRVIDEGHSLFIDQERGISEERAEELIHAALHSDAD